VLEARVPTHKVYADWKFRDDSGRKVVRSSVWRYCRPIACSLQPGRWQAAPPPGRTIMQGSLASGEGAWICRRAQIRTRSSRLRLVSQLHWALLD